MNSLYEDFAELAEEIDHPWYPPTDYNGCCLSCGSWTPRSHKESIHEHEGGCEAYLEYLSRINHSLEEFIVYLKSIEEK
jgi:hypothetical protein